MELSIGRIAIAIVIIVAVLGILKWFLNRNPEIVTPQPVMIIIYAVIAIVAIMFLLGLAGMAVPVQMRW